MPGYLEALTLRLLTGAAAFSEQVRQRHAAYFLAAQRPDGGFAGRDGASDLYYTGFGLRGLAALGALHGEPARNAGEFLRGRLGGRETIVDFLSLIYGGFLLEATSGVDIFQAAQPNWRSETAAALERLRRDDGGYAKGPDGHAGSTYYSFLVLLCRELLGAPPPDPDKLAAFLWRQACNDGGFREIRASKRAGTNPTAAAIAALRMLGGWGAASESQRALAIDLLCDMQTDEGGLRANTRIPIADLLSTFTGVLTLVDLGAADQLDLAALARWVASLELPGGGFRAADWDPAHDVEYSFYGVGCQALLAELTQPAAASAT